MSKLSSIAILAVLLVAASVYSSPIEDEKGNHLGPYKSKIYSIDLERKDAPADAKIKLIQLLQEHHNDLKLSKAEGASFLQKKKKAHTHLHEIKLGNMQNAQYLGTISIGSSTNSFKVIYDTGSANIFIDSSLCKDEGCLNHKQYDGSKFSTHKDVGADLDVEFGTGELQGLINADDVYLGGVQVKEQNLAEITHEIGPIFAQSGFDGIVGLSYPSMAAYGMQPVFDNIIKQKKLDSNVFSFYFDKEDGSMNSKLILGGVDESFIQGPITYFPVTKKYYWSIRAKSILVDGKQIDGVCNGGCTVVADTGTSLLTGPSDELAVLLDKLGVDSTCQNNRKLPKLTFVLEDGVANPSNPTSSRNVNFDLHGIDYLFEMEDDGGNDYCAAAFMPLDVPEPDGPLWILGDTFLQKYYSVYDRDNDYVGFALAKK